MPPSPFPAPTAAPIVLTHKGRADQAVGLVAWPTDDFLSDTAAGAPAQHSGRRARASADRPAAQGRERHLFAIGAASASSSVFPTTAICRSAGGDPAGQARRLLQGRRRDHRRPAGPRTSPPTSSSARRSRRSTTWSGGGRPTTTGWARWPARRPIPAAWTRSAPRSPRCERVTAADVRRMAQTYLVDGKAWRLEVKPTGAP